MRRYIAAAGLFAFAAAAAAQNSADAPSTVTVPAQKAAAPERLHISPQEFYQYEGAYRLSNGKRLTLSRRAVRLYAQIEDQPVHEIVWQGNGKFAAPEGDLSLHLVWQDEDHVSGEVSYFAPTAIAGLTALTTVRMASR